MVSVTFKPRGFNQQNYSRDDCKIYLWGKGALLKKQFNRSSGYMKVKQKFILE